MGILQDVKIVRNHVQHLIGRDIVLLVEQIICGGKSGLKLHECNFCHYKFSNWLNKIYCEGVHLIQGVCKIYG